MKSNNKNVHLGAVACAWLIVTLLLVFNSRVVFAVAESGATADTVQASSFDVSYFVPGNSIETGTKIKVEKKEEGVFVYYSLGGMRLRFGYTPAPAEKAIIKSYKWVLGEEASDTKGKICKSFKITDCSGDYKSMHVIEKNVADDSKANVLLWEPELWKNGNSLVAKLVVTYDDPNNAERKPLEEKFKIETRVLKYVKDSLMKGSDVQMLESVLWHIGMSPSKYPGVSGKRLGVEKRKEFSIGIPSVGKMIGRFNKISFSSVKNTISKQDTADEDKKETMQELGRHWKHYLLAYEAWGKKDALLSMLSESDLKAAENVFDGKISYPGGKTFADIDKTYSTDRHDKVAALTGASFKRYQILQAMAQREASGIQWKQYRVTVGGAPGDERGSKGFNQVQNRFSYGAYALDGDKASGACDEVSAYGSSGDSYVNHYDAADNIVAKAVYMAAKHSNCGRSFYYAFSKNKYQGVYKTSDYPKLYKIVTTDKKVKSDVSDMTHSDDDYELLTKAIGAYNQGLGTFRSGEGKAWLNLLVTQATLTSEEYTNIKKKSYASREASEHKLYAKTTAMEYAIDTLHKGTGSGSNMKLTLPYRMYVWVGGLGVDVNGDKKVEDIEPNNDSVPPIEGVVETTVPWCFSYSEKDWLDGKDWAAIMKAAAGSKSKAPKGRVNCDDGNLIP